MKKALLIFGLMFGLTIWSFGLDKTEAQNSPVGLNSKVVTVDVARALSVCKENVERGLEQKKLAEEVNTKLEAYDAQAKAISEYISEAVELDSDLYNEKMQEWFKVKATAEALQGYETKRMERQSRVWVEKVYEKLLVATGQIAQQQGATVVVNFDNVPIQKESKIEALYKIIYSRNVLWTQPEFDITDRVIEHMNAAYAAATKNK